MLNWVGITINFIVCLSVAIIRGQVDYDTAYGPAPHGISALLMDLFILVTVLLTISACFLADALRRLKKSFQKSNKMVVN